MKTKPLKTYPKPDYPELNREGEATVKLLLKKRVPARWKRLAASTAMLCATAGAVDGCGRDVASIMVIEQTWGVPEKRVIQGKGNVTVAPLAPEAYSHGFGEFGCVAVSPPAYMSEADAAEIIFEELAKAGIHLQPGVVLRHESERWFKSRQPVMLETFEQIHAFAFPEKQRADLVLATDWVDPEKGVAIELMTYNDGLFWTDVAILWEGADNTSWNTTCHCIHFGRAAVVLGETAAGFKAEQPLTLGIFTTPFMQMTDEDIAVLKQGKQSGEESWEDLNQRRRAYRNKIARRGEPLLRAQVKHFVKWLEEREK